MPAKHPSHHHHPKKKTLQRERNKRSCWRRWASRNRILRRQTAWSQMEGLRYWQYQRSCYYSSFWSCDDEAPSSKNNVNFYTKEPKPRFSFLIWIGIHMWRATDLNLRHFILLISNYCLITFFYKSVIITSRWTWARRCGRRRSRRGSWSVSVARWEVISCLLFVIFVAY